MMVGYSLSILITLGSCKTAQNLDKKDLENMHIQDSILQDERRIFLNDIREDLNYPSDGI